ncbi:hypothetical protein, partial [Parasutterella excrementihominis]|uniref:hypothetical protein n=1 Tax=Parasutterella excrementihominis TaxID=487175 RepID=UPI0019D604B6
PGLAQSKSTKHRFKTKRSQPFLGNDKARQPFRGFCCIDPRKIIKSGGLASIGAWRTVIEDLAVATVKCLKEELEKREI